MTQVSVILESIFGFFKKSPILYKDLLISAAFISTLGEKTIFGESRGCQIDKKKIITEITEEFFVIKQLCIKYLKFFLANCGPEERPLIAENKLEMLQIIKDFIENTLVLDLITASLQIFDRVQALLDDSYDLVNMEMFLSPVLEAKYHQLAKLEMISHEAGSKSPKLKESRRNSLKNSAGLKKHRSEDVDSVKKLEVSVGHTILSDESSYKSEENLDTSGQHLLLESMLCNSRSM